MNKLTIVLAVSLLMVSCAGSYKAIRPESLNYPLLTEEEGLKYTYRYDVLSSTGNKKYANKERKKNLRLVAIKLTNTSDLPISFSSNMKLSVGGRAVVPVDPEIVVAQIKQPSGLYMLWSFLWLFINKCENGECSSTPIPIGLLIGLGNTTTAAGSNKRLMNEVKERNLLYKMIDPEETVYGFIGVDSDYNAPLELKLRN